MENWRSERHRGFSISPNGESIHESAFILFQGLALDPEPEPHKNNQSHGRRKQKASEEDFHSSLGFDGEQGANFTVNHHIFY